jgi:23S rRNA pseudouridine1911/1915/1917 synthase
LIVDTFQIDKSNGNRLDIYLVEKLHPISRSKIKTYIKGSSILVNGNKVKPGYIIQKGDIVKVKIKDNIQNNNPIIPEKMKIDVLYEDNYVIAVNKPSGLVVHPGVKNNRGTLVNGLVYHFDRLSDINGDLSRGIVHRLDADTSGIILAAKTNKAHLWLSKQFKERTVKKTYASITWGKWEEKNGVIEGWISRRKSDPTTFTFSNISKNGRYSKTNYSVDKQYQSFAKVLFYPVTGRTHQIRVHSSFIGNPIFGDEKYGGGVKKGKEYKPKLYKYFSNELGKFGRHALHAFSIEFELFKSGGKRIKLEAPIPEDFVDLEESLLGYES